jgi:hypothetical protein
MFEKLVMPVGVRQLMALGCLVIFLPPTARAEEPDYAAHMRFVRENKDKFPLIEPGRGEPPLAKVHTIKAQAEPLKFGGRFYNGFRFDAPEWQDGDVVWLHSRTPKPGVPASQYRWSIMPEEEDKDLRGSLGYSSHEISDRLPFAKEAFPGDDSFTQQVFSRQIVKPGRRYIIWFGFHDTQRTEARFAISMNSPRGVGEWGMLPTGSSDRGPNEAHASIPPGPKKDPRQTGKEAVEIFKKSGPAAAEAFLDKELENHIRSGVPYDEFHFHIWKAVQDGEIRKNPEWGAFGFDWLQRAGLKLGATTLVENLCLNTSSFFMKVRKPGAARRAIEPWYKGMAERKRPVDPFAMEDNGPFLKELPMIRRRAFPVVQGESPEGVAPNGMITLKSKLPTDTEGSMKAIASLESSAGDWKRAIERNLWVRDLAEDPKQDVFEREDKWYGALHNIAGILHSIGHASTLR